MPSRTRARPSATCPRWRTCSTSCWRRSAGCAGSMERRPKAERLAAERIGLIAGSGRFPVLFAETARRRGVEVIAVAHRGETDPELERVVVGITWVYPGELGTIISALKKAGVRRTVMVGGIA